MGFNERVHAYIAAKFYKYLTENFAVRGERAFLHATQYYATQRGRRMAQRAIRDGEELTQATYNYYGEWVNSDEIKQEGIENKSMVEADGTLTITQCPWHQQFHDMGQKAAGILYCLDLDSSISRGFNPFLGYKVDQTLHDTDSCKHRLSSGDSVAAGAGKGKNPASLRSFEYHCAHSYWSYTEVVEAIFLAAGRSVTQQVLEDFAADYGNDMADRIISYRNTNFNVCD